MNILLSDNINAWELITDISSFVSVALGLLLAFFPDVDQYLRPKLQSLKRINQRLNKAPKTLGILTAVFTAVAWWSGGRLQGLKDYKLAIIQAESNTKIAQANLIAAQANEVAAKARLSARKIEQQNIELRESLANRQITEEQYRVVVAELSRHKATVDIEVMWDYEAVLFANDIRKVFVDAGWKTDTMTYTSHETLSGLVIFQTKYPASKNIMRSFKKANVPFTVSNESVDAGNQPYKEATILIAGKPSLL